MLTLMGILLGLVVGLVVGALGMYIMTIAACADDRTYHIFFERQVENMRDEFELED